MLGNLVEQALSVVGVDRAFVLTWLGKECNCEERKERLNQLGYWARTAVRRAQKMGNDAIPLTLKWLQDIVGNGG